MNDLQKKAVSLLNRCTFIPGSFDKRFVRTLNGKGEKPITENQEKYLWKLVWAYRKQHRNKWFTYYAMDKLALDKPQPQIDWVD